MTRSYTSIIEYNMYIDDETVRWKGFMFHASKPPIFVVDAQIRIDVWKVVMILIHCEV